MKLEPGEHTLLASFKSGPEAQEAMKHLQEAGYTEVQMDRIGAYGFRRGEPELEPVIHGKETSMVRAVLNPARLDDESRILLGATPEASGMSGPSSQDVPPFLVTVVTTDDRVEEAVATIQELGGRV